MKEVWKDVKDFEGYYQISNLGRVKSLEKIDVSGHHRKEKILKSPPNGNGYKSVSLNKNKISTSITVHRLVAIAFIPNSKNKETVNHKDGIKLDNSPENLEWMTRQENVKHGWRTGLIKAYYGEKSHHSKLKKYQVLEIKKLLKIGMNNIKIALIFGVHNSTISLIKRGKTWNHI